MKSNSIFIENIDDSLFSVALRSKSLLIFFDCEIPKKRYSEIKYILSVLIEILQVSLKLQRI
jgi:hypothetical protein